MTGIWQIPSVDYWLVPDIYASAYDSMPPLFTHFEKARSDKLVHAVDRTHYLRCRTILRTVLSTYAIGSDASADFIVNGYGKPGLAGGSPEFSLSHSGDAFLLAVSSVPVGVDIERVRDLDVAGLAAGCLSLEEWRDFNPRGPRALEMFFRIWTIKEAMLKASGHGLRIDLREISINMSNLHVRNLPDQLVRPEQWKVHAIPCPPGLHAALAVPVPFLRLRQRSVEELLDDGARGKLRAPA